LRLLRDRVFVIAQEREPRTRRAIKGLAYSGMPPRLEIRRPPQLTPELRPPRNIIDMK
jgi:hypothetical protein